jgi:hypothetical protein
MSKHNHGLKWPGTKTELQHDFEDSPQKWRRPKWLSGHCHVHITELRLQYSYIKKVWLKCLCITIWISVPILKMLWYKVTIFIFFFHFCPTIVSFCADIHYVDVKKHEFFNTQFTFDQRCLRRNLNQQCKVVKSFQVLTDVMLKL